MAMLTAFLFKTSRSAALRAGLRQRGRDFSFRYPAFIPQLASSPRKHAGLLPDVPLRGTGDLWASGVRRPLTGTLAIPFRASPAQPGAAVAQVHGRLFQVNSLRAAW